MFRILTPVLNRKDAFEVARHAAFLLTEGGVQDVEADQVVVRSDREAPLHFICLVACEIVRYQVAKSRS